MLKTIFVAFVVLFASASARSQIKVLTVTDGGNASSKTLMSDLRSKLARHSKQFTLVSNKDSDLSLIITADCLPQKRKTDPYACFYALQYAGGVSKTFMGGGIYAAATSDEVADNFLSSIAQDIVERWNEMVRVNAIENLEACLFLTQSSCKVSDSLVSELKVKVLNLSQYLQKGGLKK